MNGRTSLYRFFDDDGALLYVGITNCLPARMEQHDKDKRWWADVSQVKVEHFSTREEALAAETTAIQGEAPFWNVTHSRLVSTLDKATHLEPRLEELLQEVAQMVPDRTDPDWCPQNRWWWGANGSGNSGVYSRLKLLVGENRYTTEADYGERGPSWTVDPFFDLEDYDDYEDYGEPYVPELRPGQRPPGLYTLDEFLDRPEPPEYRSLEAWLRSHGLFLELVDVVWRLMPPHHHLQTSCGSCGWYRAEEDAA